MIRHLRLPISALLLLLAGFTGSPAHAAADRALATFDQVWEHVREHHYDYPRFAADWERARQELRPKAAGADSQPALRALLEELLARIGDSHFQILPGSVLPGAAPAGPAGSTGLSARLIDGELVITRVAHGSPAEAAGLEPGSTVERVSGESVADSLAALAEMPPGPARTRAATFLEANWHHRLAEPAAGRTLEVHARRHPGGRLERFRIRPEPAGGQVTRIGNMPPLRFEFDWRRLETESGGCIGLVAFSTWVPALTAEFDRAMAALSGCDGLVIDLRGNPGGFAGMVMPVAAHLVAEPVTLGTLSRPDGEMHFRALPRRVAADGTPVEPYGGSVAVLVDSQSASTSEIFASGLQAAGRATVVGQPTPGLALPALTLPLFNGDVLLYAFADYIDGAGRRIEGRGVEPDLPVALDPELLAAGGDPILARAHQWLDSVRVSSESGTN